jgi:hypothetical protein
MWIREEIIFDGEIVLVNERTSHCGVLSGH